MIRRNGLHCSPRHTRAPRTGGWPVDHRLKVGPELTKIGATRSGPDLLEAIVFPGASCARGYDPYKIETKEGKSYTGILGGATAEVISLRTADRAEIRVPRSSIDTMTRGRVSIMPQGLDAQVRRQELADLIAFLQSLK